jgi:hypothetical protein
MSLLCVIRLNAAKQNGGEALETGAKEAKFQLQTVLGNPTRAQAGESNHSMDSEAAVRWNISNPVRLRDGILQLLSQSAHLF